MKESNDYYSYPNDRSDSDKLCHYRKISFKYRVNHLLHKIESSLVFIALANLFWLIYKSGTKPSRIVYPCQRAAVSNIGVFAILFPFLYGEKIKNFITRNFKLNKLFSVILIITSIFGILLTINYYDSSDIPPIKPGTYGKILSQSEQVGLGSQSKYATIPAAYDLPSPHRVVAVHNSNASMWQGSGNPNNYMNQTEIDKMVDTGIMELTGTTSPRDGWKKIIPYNNGQTVAIKVNFNNNWYSSSEGFSYNDDLNTNMLNYAAVVNSVIRGLKSIGVPSDKIWITDPSRPVHDQFRERIYDKGVQYYVNQNCGAYIEGRPNVSVTGYVSDNSVYASTSTAYPEKIRPAKVFANATYIINIPQLKGHGYTSVGRVTLSLKNNFGSVYYTADALGEGPAHNADPFAKLLADINDNPVFKNKTRLVVGDGIMGNPNLNYAPPTLWNSFGNSPPETLFFGVDPVATDSVMVDYIRREVGSQATGLVQYYAADLGLGVSESWNDHENYTDIDYHPIDLDNQTYKPASIA